ncbi:MAG: DNA/RNA non-specific endonuclease [Ruminococcus flavefaciens]|nr:DNA/RNA non-specific endonuclease [Ruminococcus flavefaciens]
MIISYHTFSDVVADAEPSDDAVNKEEVQASSAAEPEKAETITSVNTVFDFSSIPAYSGVPYVAVNDNVPYFTDSDFTTASFETYSSLDSLGRCGTAYACVGQDIMPTEKRGEIGSIKPSGWHTVKYNGIVDGNYLYNRCHLIGYQLSGENANAKNLITGTRYMNVEGMLPFENMVADYVKETNNHVLYRVTPHFSGDNLLADGVLMEAESVEDKGESILFNVFCYNVQPGVAISYADGDSQLDGTMTAAEDTLSSGTSASASSEGQAASSSEQAVASSESAPASNDTAPANNGSYVVNAKNGKIHINGACAATGNGSNAMTNPVYFGTYEEAESYSIQIAPGQDKRKCGNCW